ncbi:MAG: polysaccharide pyruvyl transferase family protein [Pseudomonadota bacterium]
MSYSILTPYWIPHTTKNRERANVGDGFIMEAIINLLDPAHARYVFSNRERLTDNDIDKINSTTALILAGANQLDDNFSVVPDFSLQTLSQIDVPIIPFGIGINGESGKNISMSEETRQIISFIHERTKWSSWRCPLTIDYLEKNIPELSEHFLLTGCPVMYLGEPDMRNSIPAECAKTVAVTITDRGNYWHRETQTIDIVAKTFPTARKWLSLHQRPSEFGAKKILKSLLHGKTNRLRTTAGLCRYAEKRGFEIFQSDNVHDYLEHYRSIDTHIGSRLHAHLFFLSQRKPSFVTHVDNRAMGFSRMLGFPVYNHTNLEDCLKFDFNPCWEAMDSVRVTMDQFVNYLKEEVLESNTKGNSD